MSLKEALSKKIDSEDAWSGMDDAYQLRAIATHWHEHTSFYFGAKFMANTPWWQKREVMRIKHEVYTTTAALDNINKTFAAQYVAHVSKEDPARIAYTASTEDGMRDKQTTTTLGRFLRKHFTLLKDEQIAEIESSHRAEVSGVFLRATTADEIVRIYTSMAGDTGCMRNSPEYFGQHNGNHPSMAYEAPGMGVAYTQDDVGVVRSRSVVWDNPADPTDKRYVRVYGDPVLAKILSRAGYTLGGLCGARIKKIPAYRGGGEAYLVPYLDGPGGNQSVREGKEVVVDGEWIKVLYRTEADSIRNVLGNSYVSSATSTSAIIGIRALPSNDFTSDLTGVAYSGWSNKQATYMDAATGEFKKAAESELRELGNLAPRRTLVAGSDATVWVNGDVAYFYSEGAYWVDDENNRRYKGFRKLSAKYYPLSQQGSDAWADSGTIQVQDPTAPEGSASHTVRILDTRVVLDEEEGSETFRLHRSDVGALRKKGYINAANYSGTPVIIHKNRATVRRTAGGTVFDTGLHERLFVQVYGGEWVAKGSAVHRAVFGRGVYFSKLTGAHATAMSSAVLLDLFLKSNHGVAAQALMSMMTANPDPSIAALTVQSIEAHAALAVKVQFGYSYALNEMMGVRTHRAVQPWDKQVALAQAITDGTVAGYFNIDDLAGVSQAILALAPWVVECTTTLNAFAAQAQAEAAGQARLDGPTTAETAAAPQALEVAEAF